MKVEFTSKDRLVGWCALGTLQSVSLDCWLELEALRLAERSKSLLDLSVG